METVYLCEFFVQTSTWLHFIRTVMK